MHILRAHVGAALTVNAGRHDATGIACAFAAREQSF